MDLKPTYKMNASFTEKKNAYRAPVRRDVFNMYDRTMDLKSNPRLGNMDDVYVPRISTGYGLGYYGKRYN
jgi:hypothetical protein